MNAIFVKRKNTARGGCLWLVFLRLFGVPLTLSKHFVKREVLAYIQPTHYQCNLCFPGVGRVLET